MHLSGNPLDDIAPLATLVHLNHLFFGGTGIATIDALAGLINLATLDIGFNDVADLAALVANAG